jgi:hypothetical protein
LHRAERYLKVVLLAIKVDRPTEAVDVAVKGTVALEAAVPVVRPETEMLEVPEPPAIENCPL